MQIDKEIDTRGLNCPLPILKAKKALAAANQHFPPGARLRKSGYRLEQRVLALTFDFPDAARQQYAETSGPPWPRWRSCAPG